MQTQEQGNLYIVATPIGNLGDITLRALETLKKVDYVACEDTRQTQKLLHHFEIKKSLLACHEHNERASAEGIIKLLGQGSNVAYCSDAGTPALSDPGSRLVQSVRGAGFKVIPIPGVSAFSSLVSVAGLLEEQITFAGFLPQKGLKREKRLDQLLTSGGAVVLYESPYRIENLVQMLAMKVPQRELVVGREMTKLHEDFWFGTAEELAFSLKERKILGEFAVIVSSSDRK